MSHSYGRSVLPVRTPGLGWAPGPPRQTEMVSVTTVPSNRRRDSDSIPAAAANVKDSNSNAGRVPGPSRRHRYSASGCQGRRRRLRDSGMQNGKCGLGVGISAATASERDMKAECWLMNF